ncbi:phage tail protein [Neobacillus mesonae]|uniref:phage tail protein n=1 Tax=Neobacillus mesonae TaxID=1193713 RepID=UPI00203E054B|nr:phage tail protein [Neobacillus mesonae]MCM3567854.1 phage tail protein [Neobacillus mesonae]
MNSVSVRLDRRTVREVQRRLGDMSSKAPNVLASSLNRAVTNVASNISKELRKEYTVKTTDIKNTLDKTKASRSNLRAVVRSQGELIPLDKFKVSPKTVQPKRKKPIKIGVKKDGIKPVLHAFVTDINGIKVFERMGKPRLPIRRLFGPSVPQMLNNEEVRNRINHEGYQMFNRRLDHEINRILNTGSASS